jgi:type I restriction enzyme S subunit
MSSEWRTVKFSQAIELIGGGTPRTSEPAYWDGDIPWLSVADFNNVPRWVVTAEKKITKLGLEQSSTKLLSPGDVIISARGTVGAIAQVSKPMAFNQSCYGVRGLEGVSQTDFIFYALKHAVVELKRVAHGAVFDTITRQTFENIELQLPSLADQEQIASILGCLDERITLLLETNTTLEAIAQALFKSWFVDFDPVHAKMQGRAPEGMDEATAALFPDNFEESALGPVPKGWRIGRLDDLLVLQRGFDLPAQDRTPGDFPIIAASGPSGTHHKSMVKGPGVVTGRSGVLGRVFLELEDFWPLNTTLWVKEFKAATPCYAYEVLRLLDFKSFNAGSAVPSLNRNHIHGLPYLLPTRTCVDTFEGIASQIHRRCRVNEKQAQNLVDIRDALRPRLISGQLRISDTPNEIQGV